MSLPELNRRHKAGLFLVLVAGGISLLLDATAKQTASVAVLGIAATWAFGSVSLRTLGFLSFSLACAAGLAFLGIPVWQDWNSYRASIQDYDSAIAQLRGAVAKASIDKWGRYEEGQSGAHKQPKDDIFDEVAPDRTAILFTFPESNVPPGFVPDPLWVPTKWIDLALSVRKDKDFMAASEVDQRRYLASRDTDFRKISLADQDAFLRYVTGKGVEHGPWEDDGGATRNVEFPASVFRWFRPESEGTDWDTRFIRFAGDIADARILTAFESNLRRRPMFSIRGTLSSHLLLFLGGVTLLLAGATGDCLLLARLRKSRREARVLPT